MQALTGYTGWKFEYVKCDWSNCFDKLENGEIDIMGDISYTDERAQKMLFSDDQMGEEKYVLYADLSNMDIGMSDFKFMDGKRVGVLMGTEPEIMLTEWENKNGIHTEHVNVNNNDDVEKKLANHEIDCFVSLEESIWSEQGISSVTTIGKSGIYFAINKERSDIKTEMDYATGEVKEIERIAYSDGLRSKVNCYGANDVTEGVAIMWKENVDISITGNSTNPTRFQHPVAGTYKKERLEAGKKYFSVASGGGTGRTLHPDNMAAGPASYGMTDTMGRMHSDAQFAGSSSVPAHVEMMGLIGMGNNPMVGATVAVAVSVEEAAKAGKF
mgnify:CR=1 FL=1